ncbi:hypothetical protein M413DRAFT_438505, partial [Hebeloma cylindrosporum]
MPAPAQIPFPVANYSHLLSQISHIFDQTEVSTDNHRKNYVALYKIHLELAQYTEELPKGRVKLTGERIFQDQYKILLTKVLPIKRGESPADHIIRFLGGYTKFINEKAAEQNDLEEDEDEDSDTTASHFTAKIINWLLSGFTAKDKNVRYRVVQSVAEMVSHLGEIDEDAYKTLRTALLDRINDRETSIRCQAIMSLAKLCISEGPEDFEDVSMVEVLLDTLAYDPSADVRRTVLLAIPINPHTLPRLLERTMDTDVTIRKLLYSAVLEKRTTLGGDDGPKAFGPTHPRILSIAQRELIIRNGLGDREPQVRAAAASLLETWVHFVDVKAEEADVKVEEQVREKLECGVLSLLSLFDLGEGTVAEDALLSIFKTGVDNFKFDEGYWSNLTPERAFLARVFVEHCKNVKDDAKLENTLPVVTLIAFHIQEAYNRLIEDIANERTEDLDGDEIDRREDARIAGELVIAELLKLAVNLDYSDEIGRRKTFQLVRDMLRSEALPEKLMAPCLDILRTLSSSERDLIRLVVETVQELRDNAYEEDEDEAPPVCFPPLFVIRSTRIFEAPSLEASFQAEEPISRTPSRKSIEDMSPEQRARVDHIDLRYLSMCIGMLERVNSTFEENITLDGVLQGLIIHSVQRKEPIFRERGVKSLGLCCLIARKLALRSIPFIMSHIRSSTSNLKNILIQSLFDIFMVHEKAAFDSPETKLEVITEFLLTNILEEQDPQVKATLCKGTSKLILSGMITSVDAVKTLMKAYLSPLTINNQELRQALSFFFQMYSYSSPENQRRMREIFIVVFLDICEDRKSSKNSDDGLEIISSARVGAMFLDWTDPVQFQAMQAKSNHNGMDADECIQIDMAEDIIRILFGTDLKVEIEKEDKKVLCQLLNKLYIPDVVDDHKIRSLKLLMDNLRARRPLRDSVCNNAFTKFETLITKKFENQLEHFSEEEFRKLEELNELFMFLDSIIPMEDDDDDVDAPTRNRKRRSDTTTSESRSRSPDEKDKNKHRTKRARLSSDGEGDVSTEKGSPRPQPVPIRALPKRTAAKKAIQVLVISSDSEGDGATGPARKAGARFRQSVKTEEAELDKQISGLLSHTASSSALSNEVPYDSIMDPDSEEEEEVHDLLAEK